MFGPLLAVALTAVAAAPAPATRATQPTCTPVNLGRGKAYDYSELDLFTLANAQSQQLSTYDPAVGGKVPLTIKSGSTPGAQITFESCDSLGYKTLHDATGDTYFGHLLPGDSDSFNGCLGIRPGQSDPQLIWQRSIDACFAGDDASQLAVTWAVRVPKDITKSITATFLGKTAAQYNQTNSGYYQTEIVTINGKQTLEAQYHSGPSNTNTTYAFQLAPKTYPAGCSSINFYNTSVQATYADLYAQSRADGRRRKLTSRGPQVGGRTALSVQQSGDASVQALFMSCPFFGYDTIHGATADTYFGHLATLPPGGGEFDGCYGVRLGQKDPQLIWPRACTDDQSPDQVNLFWSLTIPKNKTQAIVATFLGKNQTEYAKSPPTSFYDLSLPTIGGRPTLEGTFESGPIDNSAYTIVLVPS